MTTPVTELTFADAEYVAPAGGPGRERLPNPFDTIVQTIAMKVDEKTKKPVAKALTFEHPSRASEKPEDAKEIERIIAKYKRQLSDAGDHSDPRVTVKTNITPAVNPVNKKPSATKSVLTFWTVKRQTRPRTEAPVIAPITGNTSA